MKERIQQLVRELNEASDAYYNGQVERMTDYEWDQRFDELKQLEQATGIILPESPTQKVSEDTIAGQKEEHEYDLTVFYNASVKTIHDNMIDQSGYYFKRQGTVGMPDGADRKRTPAENWS